MFTIIWFHLQRRTYVYISEQLCIIVCLHSYRTLAMLIESIEYCAFIIRLNKINAVA